MKQLAEILHLRPDTVLKHCHQNQWPHRKFNQRTIRFTHEDLIAILEISKSQAPEPTTTPRRRTRRPSL
ncbi:helix-turn-helix domain-containing protein [Arthrobacter sp. FW306-04-A]|uniref:helix-turn-helix domain-containing protein n=1 Tax=Arthrobacter sp. FW306-04-A TaxID=2879619 RepID=UPI0037BE345F|nr:helix-turn-helix domain-containing protein [Arthrobacter sp. FW306-04-A]